MNAIELLKDQHAEAAELFEQLEQTKDPEDKMALFHELADALAAHWTIEEKIFYPAVYTGDTAEKLQEAVEEHLSIKRLLADLIELDAEDEHFDAKIKVLKEQVEHHVEEEEKDLFVEIRGVLTEDVLTNLGEAMKEMWDEEMAGSPSDDIIDETDEAAPLR